MLISDVKKVVMATNDAGSCFKGGELMNNLQVINVKKCRWWPKGKYNGEPIQGFRLSLALHILYWRLLPKVGWNFGMPCFVWLCFTFRAEVEYRWI